MLPSNSSVLTLSAKLCCVNTLFAKPHTAFQLLHEVNIQIKYVIGRYLESHHPLRAISLVNISRASKEIMLRRLPFITEFWACPA